MSTASGTPPQSGSPPRLEYRGMTGTSVRVDKDGRLLHIGLLVRRCVFLSLWDPWILLREVPRLFMVLNLHGWVFFVHFHLESYGEILHFNFDNLPRFWLQWASTSVEAILFVYFIVEFTPQNCAGSRYRSYGSSQEGHFWTEVWYRAVLSMISLFGFVFYLGRDIKSVKLKLKYMIVHVTWS